MNLIITPQTRVGDLLAAYPALEEVLIAQSPHFAKLRHPILRRTVAKVATLQSAAAVGELEVAKLVRALREAVGQEVADAAPVATAPAAAAGPRPAWADEAGAVVALDVDQLLGSGEHPLGRVTAALREGALVRLTSSFRPEPLLEKVAAEGRRVHVEPAREGWVVYIRG